ncbi:hypothetical protein SDC9_114295 [bioreactor metagenome]|uniref:Uncharacterized protein n=1 Tax=bioreactor metagenome TaxID=1076179 RepID=A0A645BW62_9ZZZZ
MDDDRLHTALAQEDDVLREGTLELVVDHGVAAVLDDHDLAGIVHQPRQCLDQHPGLGDQGRFVVGSVQCHQELYSAFSLT